MPLMGLRHRKSTLQTALLGYEKAGYLDAQQAEGFRLMYARARTEAEQDQVTAAVKHQIDGWKTSNDRLSKILRASLGDDDEDEDPPALKEALARARVKLSPV